MFFSVRVCDACFICKFRSVYEILIMHENREKDEFVKDSDNQENLCDLIELVLVFVCISSAEVFTGNLR